MTTNTEKMNEDGRSGASAPSGYSAEPEPCSTVSAVPVSIPNAAQQIDDWARRRQAALVERSNEHIRRGRDLNDPDYRVILGEHRAYMALRSFIHGARLASAIDARQRQDNEDWPDPKGESAVAKPDAQGEPR
jgi:hypothetical protein